jgi:hypothetical protein
VESDAVETDPDDGVGAAHIQVVKGAKKAEGIPQRPTARTARTAWTVRTKHEECTRHPRTCICSVCAGIHSKILTENVPSTNIPLFIHPHAVCMLPQCAAMFDGNSEHSLTPTIGLYVHC